MKWKTERKKLLPNHKRNSNKATQKKTKSTKKKRFLVDPAHVIDPPSLLGLQYAPLSPPSCLGWAVLLTGVDFFSKNDTPE